MGAGVCAYLWMLKLMPGVFLHYPLPLHSGRTPQLNEELSNMASPASQLVLPIQSLPSTTVLQVGLQTLQGVYVEHGNVNSGLHACVASALTNEPSSWLQT